MSSVEGARVRNARGEGERLRAEILAAALTLLEQGGEEAVALRAVAREVGISAPSIYAHFSGRDAILLALAEDAFDELAAALRAGRDTADDPLRGVCEAYLRFAADRPRRYRVMFGGVWNAQRAVDRGDVTAAAAQELGGEALDIIRSAVGDALDGDPTARAVVIWLGLHGLAHQRLVAPAFPWPPDVERDMIDVLTSPGPRSEGDTLR